MGDLAGRQRFVASLGAALAAIALLIVLAARSGPVSGIAEVGKPDAVRDYGALPLSFEPNAGRTDGQVDFISRGQGYSLYLTDAGATMQLEASKQRSHVIGMKLVGGDPGTAATGIEELPGRVNSLVGDDPSKWRTGIPTYGRVRYGQVYPGIDVDWYGRQGRLEHDFRLAPGADPDRIAVRMDGADSLRLARNGDLLIGASGKTIRQRAPLAFQELDGERRIVESSYVLEGKTVSYRLGRYDRSRPLVIDPQVLIYSTYVGGTLFDSVSAIDVDSSGSAYVVGNTNSADFPVTTGPLGPGGGPADMFVSKLNPAGTGLVYSTYLGGTDDETGIGIDVDSGGRAYVVGNSASTNYPLANQFSADPEPANTSSDIVVSVLSPSGSELAYSSYLGSAIGGDEDDFAGGIRVGVAGRAYVVGSTEGTDFPVTANAFQATKGGGQFDAIAAIFDPNAAGTGSLLYSTYIGGTGDDFARDVDSAPDGDIILGGYNINGDFDVTPGAFDTTFAGPTGTDGFLAKIDPDAMNLDPKLEYSTYLGGDGVDEVNALDALDGDHTVQLTGLTTSSDQDHHAEEFPTTDGAYRKEDPDPPDGGDFGMDAFFTVLDLLSTAGPPGEDLVYSTFLGGSAGDLGDPEVGLDLRTDRRGRAVILGSTPGPNFPTTPGSYDTTHNGQHDFFVARISPDPDDDDPPDDDPPPDLAEVEGDNNDLLYSTYIGGSGDEASAAPSGGVGVDDAGRVYIAGSTFSTDFPTASPFDSSANGAQDFVVAKILPYPQIDGSPLNIFVDDFGQVIVSIDGQPANEFDTNGAGEGKAGISVRFPGSSPMYGANFFGPLADDDLAPVESPTLSGSGSTFKLTTKYSAVQHGDADPGSAADVLITQTDTYVNGEYGYSTEYRIEHSGGLKPVVLQAIVGADLVTAGEDSGVGNLDSSRFLSGLSDPYQTGNGLLEVTPWNAYQADDVSNLSLGNQVNSSTHDTGVAAMFSRTLGPGDPPAVFSTRWQFRRVPAAIHGQKVVLHPAGGTVLVKAPGQANFRELLDDRRVPIGTLIDVRNGTVDVTAENASGVHEIATFWAGLFEAQQDAGGPFNARLAEELSCGRTKKKKKKKKRKGRSASAAGALAYKAATSRQLWGRAKGKFKTTGYRGSATVRGTEWETTDRCARQKGKRVILTSFRSVEGQLDIDDFTKKGAVNKILGPGKPYVAGAPKKKKKKKKK